MNEKELFVDNPLELTGLFSAGVFLAKDKKAALEGVSDVENKVLVLLHYPELDVLPTKALDTVQKIMGALKLNGVELSSTDYSIVNSGKLAMSIPDYIIHSQAIKVLFWSDKWVMDVKEIAFYKTDWLENVEILRCHSLHTVMQDLERKNACWSAIRAFFGM